MAPMNATPCVVELDARNFSFTEAPVALRLWTFTNFRANFAHEKCGEWVQKEKGKLIFQTKRYVETWLESDKANRCEDIVFNVDLPPCASTIDGYQKRVFNFWQGLPVQPIPGDCNHILAMMETDLSCSTDEKM
jgi:hypothetical protein